MLILILVSDSEIVWHKAAQLYPDHRAVQLTNQGGAVK